VYLFGTLSWTGTVLVLSLRKSSDGVIIGNIGKSLKLFLEIAEKYGNEKSFSRIEYKKRLTQGPFGCRSRPEWRSRCRTI
jgi:hypothetical protein